MDGRSSDHLIAEVRERMCMAHLKSGWTLMGLESEMKRRRPLTEKLLQLAKGQ